MTLPVPSPAATVRRDIPQPSRSEGIWGSDALAEMIRSLDIPYVCLNPGSSFRGLHDSLVNHLGNEKPQMLLCLHEEHAVAMAHGYAKVTGKPLGAIVHSNVGLMHATMAIYDIWCDRLPVVIMGATGPVDAARRRPWIDWLHTAQDQGALVRHYTKWDCQPASVGASYEALLRAKQIAETAPPGPTYVCFDAAMQEQKLDAIPPLPDASRYAPPPTTYPDPKLVDQALALLKGAKNPMILMGRATRDKAAWDRRVQLAETLNAKVLTDLKTGAAFPTDHPLHLAPPGVFLSGDTGALLKQADVVLSLDWVDLAGTLKQGWGNAPVGCKVIQVSVDQYIHNGWSMDHQGLPPADIYLACGIEPVVEELLARLDVKPASDYTPAEWAKPAAAADGSISIHALAATLKDVVGDDDICLMRLPLGWAGDMWHFRHPLDYLGGDGGGGIGSGPGMSVGSALALKDTGRLPVSILGDGDFMMGNAGLWTAANAGIPMLIITANNRSFFNDEVHQERVAKERGRPVENRWIGQRIDDPAPDLAMMARAQGLKGVGPVTDPGSLADVLREAIAAVREGAAVVVDVHVTAGYSPSMAAGMTRSHDE